MRAPLALVLLLVATGAGAQPVGGRVECYHVNIVDDDASLTLTRKDLFAGTTTESAQAASGANDDFGIRGMVWGETAPWVAGIDIGFLKTQDPALDVSVQPVSVFGGLRLVHPLLARNGHGMHPYALLGVTGFSVWGDARTATLATRIDTRTTMIGGGEPHYAPYVAAGIEWSLSPRVALVLDWRVQHFRFDHTSTNSMILPTRNDVLDAELDASGVGIGIAWTAAPGSRPATAPAAPAAP